VASWLIRPDAAAGEWTCFRQTSPDWPALYHNAGVPSPDQESGRWHRKGQGYAQYLSLSPLGAWAEYARYASVRSVALAAEVRRNMWCVFVRETEIADLSTFDRYSDCGLDPVIAVGEHAASQLLADDLRADGFRGVLSPSAALPRVVNLTIFGERYEKELRTSLEDWRNPDVDSFLPVQIVAREAPLPAELCTETVFRTKRHEGYRAWLSARGLPLPIDPP
jgi:RES domain-containing protein